MMLEIVDGRSNPQIDPHLSIWEWHIPGYLFLGGLVAGLMIINGLWRLTRDNHDDVVCISKGSLWAPFLISIGMLLLFLDLSYKTHVFQFYTTFQVRSPMSWGAWILLFVYPVQLLTITLPGGPRLFTQPPPLIKPAWTFLKTLSLKWEKVISWSNIVLGILLGFYTGILLSTFAARPLWNTTLLAPLFLVSGLSAALAWNLLGKPHNQEKQFLLRWDLGLLLSEIILILLIIIGLLTGSQGQQESVLLLMGGKFTASFWVFVVFLGILLPLWLEIREFRHQIVPNWLGPILILIGGLALRFVFVEAGQISHVPETELLIGQFIK